MPGLKGNFDCIVGVDVSKDKFDACGITGEETKLFQISTSVDRKGFEKLKRNLGTFPVSSVLIGMVRHPIMLISSHILLLRVTRPY